jgi:6-pyruvoyltetrahydropterin/6-carboxytetrahydropterin synthase
MYKINKSFDFCYGHSVWTQQLNTEFSIDGACVCRHMHGHQGQVTIKLEAETLNESSMVTDFKHLNWFKKFLDDVLDHKMIMDIHDPALRLFFPLFNKLDLDSGESVESVDFNDEFGYFRPHYTDHCNLTPREVEIYEGLIIVDFVPTSENLSKWFFDIIRNKMHKLATVIEVTFKETPKTGATYTN